ncbi:MAG: hypothetical protein WA787_04665, partial [Azonexus sp.]
PCGGFSVIGSSAVWTTGPRDWVDAGAGFARLRLVVGFPAAGFDAGLASDFFFAASASAENRDSAAADARKSRRFKNFLRRRQPVAETKRPCH